MVEGQLAIVRPPHGPVVPLIHRPALRSDVDRAKHRNSHFLSHNLSNSNLVPGELSGHIFSVRQESVLHKIAKTEIFYFSRRSAYREKNMFTRLFGKGEQLVFKGQVT